jgi:hypothetical protein
MERFFFKKIQKHKEERDRAGNFQKKQEGKNGGKKKKRFFFKSTWRFPYSCVLHRSGTPSGLCPCVTLAQERTHWYGNLPYNIYTPSPWLQCQGVG